MLLCPTSSRQQAEKKRARARAYVDHVRPRAAAHCAVRERMIGRAQALPGPTVARPLVGSSEILVSP